MTCPLGTLFLPQRGGPEKCEMSDAWANRPGHGPTDRPCWAAAMMCRVPYTPVHALVSLPLAGRRARRALPPDLLLWALPAFAVGAMVPDAPLFLDVLVPGTDELARPTHRLLGVVTVDLALTLAFTALWVLVVRGPFLAALPRRSAPVPDASTRAAHPLAVVGTVVGFAVAGTLTHILWDDFTHLRGTAVQTWDVLRTPVAGVTAYKYLQHGSSLVGFATIAVLTVRWWRRAEPVSPPQHLRSAVLAVGAGAAVGTVGAVVRLVATDHAVTVFSLARLAATHPVLGAGLGLVVWAVACTTVRHRDGRPSAALGAAPVQPPG
ncbi:DUF4184 family protein [Oerskovia turbata]|uniref:DUF4184 family protein n=1 Tax=Oerskovia turbata TaxID=1713 RepID=A0A4Q1KXH3_9CELL|nr:DUF4184 family protein [Oerskovia turbata]RXR35028.1 DUF4184 family protein [Oerskovia turbata]